ncbi:MAG: glutaredoxin, partial [Nitrospirae bacterium]|nr:glutaredoxin [Nitrospirota bacterium]
MASAKRTIEVFTAGCPVCDDTVRLVKSLLCPSCDLQIYDLRESCATNECRDKARRYGITAVPAVAV